MSSELILAKKLATTDDFILSHDWYYSTEIRVLHQQVVFSTLFHLFDDWQTVQILGTIFLYAAHLASWYYLCCRMQIRSAFPITAGLLMMPISEAYSYIVLFGAFYIPHMILIFLILGIVLGQIQEGYQSKGPWFWGTVLSLIAGMGGLRLLLLLFMPVGVIALWRLIRKGYASERRFFMSAVSYCLAALLGYATNVFYLSKHYPFENFANTKLLIANLRGIQVVLDTWVYALSDRTQTFFSIFAIVMLAIAFCCWITVYRNRKSGIEKHNMLALYSFLCAGFLCFVYLFTDMFLVDWYLVPAIILLIPLFYIAIRQYKLRRLLYLAMILVMTLCGIRGYVSFAAWRLRTERVSLDTPNVAEFLIENEYYNGYATFWNANVITEMTDGKVEVWTLAYNNIVDDSFFDERNLYKWLQSTNHLETKPDGDVFLLLSVSENQNADTSIIGLPIIYQSSSHIIYDVTALIVD